MKENNQKGLIVKIEISKIDLRETLIFAFRYALGRTSMAPFGVTTIIKDHISIMSEFDKEQMIMDIEQTIERGDAGMACDIALWTEFAEYLKTKKD